MQTLLLPDPRPLVERLGQAFFRSVPDCAGVYLMRDEQDQVLYVGRAKNLRNRLRSYRVAKPDRVPRRHLRLLRVVRRIELEPCADEVAALVREGELLRALRPNQQGWNMARTTALSSMARLSGGSGGGVCGCGGVARGLVRVLGRRWRSGAAAYLLNAARLLLELLRQLGVRIQVLDTPTAF